MSERGGVIYGCRSLLRWSRAYPNGRLAFWGVALNAISYMILPCEQLGWDLLQHVPPPFGVMFVIIFEAVAWITLPLMIIAWLAGPLFIAFACWKAFHDSQSRQALTAMGDGKAVSPRAPIPDATSESN